MNLYTTSIQAICPKSGKIKTYGGPHVPGISFDDAAEYCEMNGLGYCQVEGLLVAEIPCKEGTYYPDYDKMTYYENIKNN